MCDFHRNQSIPVWLLLPAAVTLMPDLSQANDAPAQAPTVGKLLEVCDRGFAQGDKGIDAAMCEWYAAPCACRSREADPATARWCAPDTERIDDTVRKVVARLRRYDRAAPAEAAVMQILSRIYPCPPQKN
jgi:hypothetical protein